jgi:hypothetical protein
MPFNKSIVRGSLRILALASFLAWGGAGHSLAQLSIMPLGDSIT